MSQQAVDPGLDVGMSFQSGVHAAIELLEMQGALAQEMRSQFAQAGADAVGIGRQIERPERTDLAEADHTGIGGHFDHGGPKTVTALPPDHL